MLAVAETARSEGAAFQARLLEDGVVDDADREDAFQAFRTCATDGGLVVSDPTLSPIDGLTYFYSVDAGQLAAGAANRVQASCFDSNFSYVSAYYVGTHEPVMDGAVMAMSAQCMNDADEETRGDESNLLQLVNDPADTERVTIATDCVSDAVRELHPEITEFAISF